MKLLVVQFLYAAHKELEEITLDKDTLHFKYAVSQKYGELVYDGLWFTTMREALDAFIDKTQRNCNRFCYIKTL